MVDLQAFDLLSGVVDVKGVQARVGVPCITSALLEAVVSSARLCQIVHLSRGFRTPSQLIRDHPQCAR